MFSAVPDITDFYVFAMLLWTERFHSPLARRSKDMANRS